MSQLMTDWLCIATEGETVDGRVLKREWLSDAAELYDPKLYTALIWPEHNDDGQNMGEVLSLMAAEDEDGVMKLFARLRPNKYLLFANDESQLLFTSVELTPDENWRGTGKCYLEGLGVTDHPASVGTTRLQFAKNKTHPVRSAYIPLRLGHQTKDFSMKKQSNWQKMFGIKKNFEEQDNEPDTPTLEQKVQALAEALNAFETRLKKVEDAISDVETEVEEVQETVDTVKTVVDTEEFAQLRTELPDMLKKFSELGKVTTKLPDGNPNGDKGKKFNFL